MTNRKELYKRNLDAPRAKGNWWFSLYSMDGRFYYHLNCSDWRSFVYHIEKKKFAKRGGGTMILPKTIEKEFLEKIEFDAIIYEYDENGKAKKETEVGSIEIIDFDGTRKTVDENDWSKTTILAMANSNRFIHKVIYNGEVIYENDVFKEQS